jgi:competence protein ComEA
MKIGYLTRERGYSVKNWWLVALGIILGLLSAGVILLASAPARGQDIILLPPPSPIPFQVQISGAVRQPGVYELPPGSRVQDAIDLAGGFTIDANKSILNLAAHVEDGVRIDVPYENQVSVQPSTETDTSINDTALSQADSSPSEPITGLININTADQSALETLSGIGPVIASRIITFRDQNGPFSNIVDIQKVSGIGPATFDKIKDFIIVVDQP